MSTTSTSQSTIGQMMLMRRGGPLSYYVDATSGSDSKTGLSPDEAWQTITKVNAASFNPGERVLFKRGETWTGTALVSPSSGLTSRPITFGAYGSGAKPIIDGNDTVNCILTSGRDYLSFNNIMVVNGLDFGFVVAGSSFVTMTDCEADGCGNDNVIVDGSNNVIISGLLSTNPYTRVGGLTTCIEIIDGSHDVVFSNSTLSGSAHAGMSIHSHAGETMPYNVTVSGISSTGNGWRGINIDKQDNGVVSDRNINISDCDFSENTQDNIFVQSSGGTDVPGITFDNCTSFNSTLRPVYIFTGGWATFKRCAFEGVTQSRLSNAGEVAFYNCTFYRTANVAFDVKLSIGGLTMRNCIIKTAGTSIIVIDPTNDIDIDYTLYDCDGADPATASVFKWGGAAVVDFANWKINSSQDANSPTPTDPLFTDMASDDFTLQTGSPAIDAGVDVGLPYQGTAPDCGAYEKE